MSDYTPDPYDKMVYEKDQRIRELETRLTESEQHRTKNRDTAVALQDEVTDLRMKLGFRDAHIESLQNKWASRPLSSEDQSARIARLENAIRWACGEIGEFPGEDTGKGRYHWRTELRRRAGVPYCSPLETPEAMHARIVTETADAIASQMETISKPEIDQAPIARVIVTDDAPAAVILYAPGLPIGEHDLYCEPITIMKQGEENG